MRDRGRIAFVLPLALVIAGAIVWRTSFPSRADPATRSGGPPLTAARSPGHDARYLVVDGAIAPPSAAAPLAVTGAVAEDACLHCHVAGENRNPIAPTARWALFGGMGLVFVVGMLRSATVWRTRRPWQPFAARAAAWVDYRYGVAAPLSQALSKPVPGFARRWFYCLGGVTAFLFVTQAVTGTLLAFYYKPTPDAARASIEFIQNEVRFGSAIRFIHQMSSNGMIVLCLAHMARVFVMGAYKPPRELTWVSGALLLVLTLAFGFTGYLLPWDQRAFWATTVGSEIGGSIPIVGGVALLVLRVGWDVGALTLSRFYAAHVLVLPMAVVGLMVAHFLMIRRLGIARPL